MRRRCERTTRIGMRRAAASACPTLRTRENSAVRMPLCPASSRTCGMTARTSRDSVGTASSQTPRCRRAVTLLHSPDEKPPSSETTLVWVVRGGEQTTVRGASTRGIRCRPVRRDSPGDGRRGKPASTPRDDDGRHVDGRSAENSGPRVPRIGSPGRPHLECHGLRQSGDRTIGVGGAKAAVPILPDAVVIKGVTAVGTMDLKNVRTPLRPTFVTGCFICSTATSWPT
jgi:hypothetical protein